MPDQYVYFLYSEQQRDHRSTIEAKMCRTFVPGTVVVNGIRKRFTEISSKSENLYPDTTVVAKGYKSKMKYVDIQVKTARK